MEAELHALRPAFPLSDDGQRVRTYFDECLAANEFGLALDSLCDCLFESNDAVITPELLMAVSRLHARMGVTDDRAMRQLAQRLGP